MAEEPDESPEQGGKTEAQRLPKVVFPFEVRYPFAHIGRLFGVQPERARLELEGERLTAVFGPWRVETSIDNIESAEATGPYGLLKVVGPAHLSLSDGGLTFATNTESGLCLKFREPVRGLLPMSLVRHGSLTVTVAHPDEVRATLNRAVRSWHETSDRDSAIEAIEQTERDAIEGSTTAELRKRADALGISNTSALSHAELVEAMEAGAEPDGPR